MPPNDSKDLTRAISELNRTLGQLVRVSERNNALFVTLGRAWMEKKINVCECGQIRHSGIQCGDQGCTCHVEDENPV